MGSGADGDEADREEGNCIALASLRLGDVFNRDSASRIDDEHIKENLYVACFYLLTGCSRNRNVQTSSIASMISET